MFGKNNAKDLPISEITEIITERDRLPVDVAKVEAMTWLLNKTANEDLDAVWVAFLTELDRLGYKLAGEPEALLEDLKRLF